MTTCTQPSLLLVRHIDPAHSWLAVPRSLIQQLGIGHRISVYSYADAYTVYLEEDDDMPMFEAAAERAGLDIIVDGLESDEPSLVRTLTRYCPATTVSRS